VPLGYVLYKLIPLKTENFIELIQGVFIWGGVRLGNSEFFSLNDVNISYGRIRVIKNVSMKVEPGESVALLGPNGSGKSTLMNGIIGLKDVDGEVLFNGEDIGPLSAHEIAHRKIALASERGSFFPTMNVAENLLMSSITLSQEDRQERLKEVLGLFPRLDEREKQEVQSLSGGERKMLTIGMALMKNPELVLADEPAMGLAVGIVEDVISKLNELNDRGIAIITAEQNIDFVINVADKVYLLDMGKLSDPIPADKLEESEFVEETYFGE
jgi:branched-chain amino acid transport system ATP-binding protein